MIKQLYVYIGIPLFVLSCIIIYSLYTENNKVKAEIVAVNADKETMAKHYDAQIAILKVPKESKKEDKIVYRTITVTKQGEKVIVEKEVSKSIIEREPVILETPSLTPRKFQRRFYVSGNYGQVLQEWTSVWGVGAGYNFTDYLSAGIRYDKGVVHNISIEMRVNF